MTSFTGKMKRSVPHDTSARPSETCTSNSANKRQKQPPPTPCPSAASTAPSSPAPSGHQHGAGHVHAMPPPPPSPRTNLAVQRVLKKYRALSLRAQQQQQQLAQNLQTTSNPEVQILTASNPEVQILNWPDVPTTAAAAAAPPAAQLSFGENSTNINTVRPLPALTPIPQATPGQAQAQVPQIHIPEIQPEPQFRIKNFPPPTSPFATFSRVITMMTDISTLRTLHVRTHKGSVSSTTTQKKSRWDISFSRVNLLHNGHYNVIKGIQFMERLHQTMPAIDARQSPSTALNRCHARARRLWSGLGRYETALNVLAQEALPTFIFRDGPFNAVEIAWLKRTPQLEEGQCLLLLLTNRALNPVEIFTIPTSETPVDEAQDQDRLAAGTNLMLIRPAQ